MKHMNDLEPIVDGTKVDHVPLAAQHSQRVTPRYLTRRVPQG
jgi:hypothetical protein